MKGSIRRILKQWFIMNLLIGWVVKSSVFYFENLTLNVNMLVARVVEPSGSVESRIV
jgi:hypothetical protein